MTFAEWLGLQAERRDQVGDLARFAAKEDFPLNPVRRDLESALAAHGASQLATAVAPAVDEWEVARLAEVSAENDAAVAASKQATAEAEAATAAEKERLRKEREVRVIADPRVERKKAQAVRDAEATAAVQAEIDAAKAKPAKAKKGKP